MSTKARKATECFGVAGGTARGTVFAVVAMFAVAAVRYQPDKTMGSDDTLRSFRSLPAGPCLLAMIALGLPASGVFSWCEAPWRKP